MSRRAFATVLLATTVLAPPALAQTAPEADVAADEIIVTAQKRAESLQDVPISIQALGTQKLDQLNVTNFNTFSQLLPSVAFQTVQPGQTSIYMRGVASGGDGNHSGPLPSVGLYLDEQPVTTIGGNLDIYVYDLARIEALSGPQGTLYGASSQAGTIRLITNRPELGEFSGRVDAEINTVNKGGVGGALKGVVNLPVGDNAALRVVGWYQRDAGYIDNIAGTRAFRNAGSTGSTPADFAGGIVVNNSRFVQKDFNTNGIYGGRAALRVDLDENWTVTPSVLFQQTETRGNASYQPATGDLVVQRFYPDVSNDRYIQGALTIEGKLGNWDLTYAGAYLDRQVNRTGDYTDYAEAYDSLYASVGGLAGYFYFQNAAGQTIDPRQFTTSNPKYRKLSQEFRVSSPADERFRVVAGAFYQRQENDIDERYIVPGLGPQVSVNGLPGILWLTKQKRVDRDYALFGEASFDITPTLTLTAGGRGFIYNNTLIGFFGFGRNPAGTPFNAAGSSRTGVAGCYTTTGAILRNNPTGTLLPATIAPAPCTNLGDFNTRTGRVDPKQADGQGFTHRLNLTWKPTRDLLFYGTWSRGFRPGGINRRAGIPSYVPDYLTNYELGWKTTFLDGRLRVNGAVYQQEWKNFQFAFLGQNSFTQIQNGPNARIRGIEFDVTLAPVQGLTLTASGAYNDAKTTQNLCESAFETPPCTGNVLSPSGTRLPITPRFKGNASARYSFELGGDSKAYLQGVVVHASSATSDIRVANAAAIGFLPAYTYANFAVGLDWQRFSIEAFLQNAFDERAQISRGIACSVCFQRVYTNIVTPRTIGLRVGTKF